MSNRLCNRLVRKEPGPDLLETQPVSDVESFSLKLARVCNRSGLPTYPGPIRLGFGPVGRYRSWDHKNKPGYWSDWFISNYMISNIGWGRFGPRFRPEAGNVCNLYVTDGVPASRHYQWNITGNWSRKRNYFCLEMSFPATYPTRYFSRAYLIIKLVGSVLISSKTDVWSVGPVYHDSKTEI